MWKPSPVQYIHANNLNRTGDEKVERRKLRQFFLSLSPVKVTVEQSSELKP